MKNHEKRYGMRLSQRGREEWRILGLHLLFAAAAAVISRAELLFGVRPFGIALAAAAGQFFPSIVAGCTVGLLFCADYLSLCALGALTVLRLFFSMVIESGEKARPLRERPSLRICAAAASVLLVGIFTAIRGGYRYFELFALLLAVAAAPIASLLYLGLFEKKEGLFVHAREAGIAALICTLIFSLRTLQIAGLWPAAVGAALFAFLLVASRGMAFGVLAGALTGLCFELRLAPAFLLAALCFSLLEKSSRGGGVLAGAVAGGAWGFLVDGISGLSCLLPSLLFAGALFLATDSTGLVEGAPSRRAVIAKRRACEQSARAATLSHTQARLREISGAFADLSGTFFEACDRRRRPLLSELHRLCRRTFDKVCTDCPKRELCWGSSYAATAQAVTDLGKHLHSKGEASSAGMPAELVGRCEKLPSILGRINEGTAQLTDEALRGDKTAVIAGDYAVIARMLGDIAQEVADCTTADPAVGMRIAGRLSRMGFVLESAAVCKSEHHFVVLRGVRLPGEHLKIRDLRRVLEPICGFSLGDPAIETTEGLADITFPERESLHSRTVCHSRPKNGSAGHHCGDSVSAFRTDAGFDYALLCDGMGTGNAAALASAIATMFLTRMLRAGGGVENSLKMLNGILAAWGRRENETSTTADLLEIDRVSGQARLYKCGAAPTFLLRGGEVSVFSSRTAPVGILEALDAERIRIDLQEGDVLLQVSDGVSGGEERCAWLEEMLAQKWDGDADNFARRVLGHAADNGDDLSIAITEILHPESAEQVSRSA